MVESTQLAMGSNRETTQELIGTSMPRELLVDPERALERLLGPPSKLVQPGGLVVEGVTGVYPGILPWENTVFRLYHA